MQRRPSMFAFATNAIRFSLMPLIFGGCTASGTANFAPQATHDAPDGRVRNAASGAEQNAKGFATLYSFAGGSDGANPYGGVVVDKSGNVFGTTAAGGGSVDCGTLYELSPSGETYAETLVHTFANSDGCGPNAGPLEDSSGNLYATAASGGFYNNGAAVKVHPAVGGYSETGLYSFGKQGDGVAPDAALLALSGTLYTTTYGGGSLSRGAIVRMTESGLGESVVYAFKGGADGALPFANLTPGAKGALYGTTTTGGASSDGTVFKFVPSGNGGTETVLWSFKGGPGDGASPFAGVVVDASGNIYGTTENGGTQNKGVVFKLTSSGSTYTESILHSFVLSDGYFPNAVALKGTNLVGTALYGGPSNACGKVGCGTIFKVTTTGQQFAVLHAFGNSDGASPEGPLLVKGAALIGTTVNGGAHGQGTVFSFVP